ncbi:hypothetical protein [Desertivirga arenae]|uniref:hypothetical protein n=1 Tax=Desertivirga arenae TaxID=2810309 RepID=UPI001A976D80|nr:hypothetical protein [Pedobacter sp. SYSU D00823]
MEYPIIRQKALLGLPLILLFALSSSCQVTEKEPLRSSQGKLSIGSASIQDTTQKPSHFDQQNYADSIRLRELLDSALTLAGGYIHLNEFIKKYEVTPDDSSQNFEITIRFGSLFSKNKKHLLIRRRSTSSTYMDLYILKADKFESVLSREQESMSYLRDTIRDVNGDGLKDFLVHWYPSSGCCRRNVYNVYLLRPDNRTFTKDYEFINPTFFPKEGIIRGVGYGHPGEVELYKCKWRGLKVDTIEFIYPDRTDTISRRYFKTKKYRHSSDEITKTIIADVPIEYHRIEDYEWFNDY